MSSSLHSQIAASLAAHGVTVPPNADEPTLISLVVEALVPRPKLTKVEGCLRRLIGLLEQLEAPQERLSGSLAWRARRRREQLFTEKAEAETALVRELREAFPGCVLFSEVARPQGADLAAFGLELLERHARGELPLPGIGRQ